jgi:Xaa-Pro aminopeptidase
LSERESEWLNAYHKEVLEKTGPFFKDDARTKTWLERECAPY